MALETATYIADLVSTNPVGTDTIDKADDHLRLIKSTIKATLPSVAGPTIATSSYNAPLTPSFQLVGVDVNTSSQGIYRYSVDAYPPRIMLSKSRGATANTHSVVSAGDSMGAFGFAASDGTSFLEAARIEGYVDGTPGTNDMPGRLVFYTTADAAATPTERMRIDNAGNVGIGVSPSVRLHTSVATGNYAARFVSGSSTLDYAEFSGKAYLWSSGSELWTGTNSSHAVVLGTNNVERLRIDTSGNVGIGGTPAAYASYTTLTLNGTDTDIDLNRGGVRQAAFYTTSTQVILGTIANVPLVIGTNNTNFVKLGTDQSLTLTGTGGLGYGTGSGGAVTQLTSKTTGVTLNKTNGQITMNNAALGAGASVNFSLTNSTIGTNDILHTTISNNGNYTAVPIFSGAGSCSIRVTNISGGSLSDAVVVNFAVFKAVNA